MLAHVIPWEIAMGFASRLTALRKQRGLTQQALAEKADLHIVQICRYETGKAEPTLEAIRKLARALHARADALVFEQSERDMDDELRMQFEAIGQFTPEEKEVAKSVLESLILKHTALRFSRAPKKTG
jgi:transcriptional regulator with XRE-family HTH domain